MHTLNVVASLMASVARLGTGVMATKGVNEPREPLALYEFEGCPFCRKVRDALTVLDLDAHIYPCPKGGTRFRPEVIARGGRSMFPYLVDPNHDVEMYESDDIIEYLYRTYGGRRPPLLYRASLINTTSSFLAAVWRPTSGSRVRASHLPEKKLELWSFEESPYCRLVRERLCEMELPYVLHNVGKGAAVDAVPRAVRDLMNVEPPPSTDNRREFVHRAGKMQVPYLLDPNTGREMHESADILQYLETEYGA